MLCLYLNPTPDLHNFSAAQGRDILQSVSGLSAPESLGYENISIYDIYRELEALRSLGNSGKFRLEITPYKAD